MIWSISMDMSNEQGKVAEVNLNVERKANHGIKVKNIASYFKTKTSSQDNARDCTSTSEHDSTSEMNTSQSDQNILDSMMDSTSSKDDSELETLDKGDNNERVIEIMDTSFHDSNHLDSKILNSEIVQSSSDFLTSQDEDLTANLRPSCHGNHGSNVRDCDTSQSCRDNSESPVDHRSCKGSEGKIISKKVRKTNSKWSLTWKSRSKKSKKTTPNLSESDSDFEESDKIPDEPVFVKPVKHVLEKHNSLDFKISTKEPSCKDVLPEASNTTDQPVKPVSLENEKPVLGKAAKLAKRKGLATSDPKEPVLHGFVSLEEGTIIDDEKPLGTLDMGNTKKARVRKSDTNKGELKKDKTLNPSEKSLEHASENLNPSEKSLEHASENKHEDLASLKCNGESSIIEVNTGAEIQQKIVSIDETATQVVISDRKMGDSSKLANADVDHKKVPPPAKSAFDVLMKGSREQVSSKASTSDSTETETAEVKDSSGEKRCKKKTVGSKSDQLKEKVTSKAPRKRQSVPKPEIISKSESREVVGEESVVDEQVEDESGVKRKRKSSTKKELKNGSSEKRHSKKSVGSDDDSTVRKTRRNKRLLSNLEGSEKEDVEKVKNKKDGMSREELNKVTKRSNDDAPVKLARRSGRKTVKIQDSYKEDEEEIVNETDGKCERVHAERNVTSDDDTPVKQKRRTRRKCNNFGGSDEEDGEEVENEKHWKSEKGHAKKHVRTENDSPVKQAKKTSRHLMELGEDEVTADKDGKSNDMSVNQNKRKSSRLKRGQDTKILREGDADEIEQDSGMNLCVRKAKKCAMEKLMDHDEKHRGDIEKKSGGENISGYQKMKPSPKRVAGPIAPIFLPGAWRKAKQKLKDEEEQLHHSIVDVSDSNQAAGLDSSSQAGIITIDDTSPNEEPIKPYSPIKDSIQSLQAFMGLFKPVVMKSLVVVKHIEAPFPKISHVQQANDASGTKWKLPMVRNRFVKKEFFDPGDNHQSYNFLEPSTFQNFLIVRPSQMVANKTVLNSFLISTVPEMSKVQAQTVLACLKTFYQKIPIKKLFKRCRIQQQRCEKELRELETLNTERRSTISKFFQSVSAISQKDAEPVSSVASKSSTSDVQDAEKSKRFTRISKKNATGTKNEQKVAKVSPLLAAFKKQSEVPPFDNGNKTLVCSSKTKKEEKSKQTKRKTSLRDYLNVSGGASDGVTSQTAGKRSKESKNAEKVSKKVKRTRGKSQKIEEIFENQATGQDRNSQNSEMKSGEEGQKSKKRSGLRGKGNKKGNEKKAEVVVDVDNLGDESGKENVKKREREIVDVERSSGPVTKKAKLVKDDRFLKPAKKGRKRKDKELTVVSDLVDETDSGVVKSRNPKMSSDEDFAVTSKASKRWKRATKAEAVAKETSSPSEGTRKSSRLKKKLEEEMGAGKAGDENLENDKEIVGVTEIEIDESKEEDQVDEKNGRRRVTRLSIKNETESCPEKEMKGKPKTNDNNETQNSSNKNTKLDHEKEKQDETPFQNETKSKEKTNDENEMKTVKNTDNVTEVIKSESTVLCTSGNSDNLSPKEVEQRSLPVLWTECFKPGRSEEMLGNISGGNKLKNWLKEWRSLREKKLSKKRRHQERKRERLTMPKSGAGEWWYEDEEDSDFDVSDDSDDSYCDEEDALCNTMLITGPTGCGKTSAVYACAKELGFKVLEVNSSTKRGGKYILTEFQEATQSHQVSRKRQEKDHVTPFTPSAPGSLTSGEKDVSKSEKPPRGRKGRKKNGKSKTKERPENKEESKENSSQHTDIVHVKMSLILLDEVDVLFEDDKGFWAAVNSLRLNSKRPIVMTSSDRLENIDGIFEHIVLKSPAMQLHAAYLQTVCLSKDVFVNPSDIQALATIHGGDVRQSLHNLQFWVDSNGGACDPTGCDRVTWDIDEMTGKKDHGGCDGKMRDQGECEGKMKDQGGCDEEMTDQQKFNGSMKDQRVCDRDLMDQGGCNVEVKDHEGSAVNSGSVVILQTNDTKDESSVKTQQSSEIRSSLVPDNPKITQSEDGDRKPEILQEKITPKLEGDKDITTTMGAPHLEKDIISNDVALVGGEPFSEMIDLHKFYMESFLGLRNLTNNAGGALHVLRCGRWSEEKPISEYSFGYKCLLTSHCQSLGIDVIRCNLATLLPCLFSCIHNFEEDKHVLRKTDAACTEDKGTIKNELAKDMTTKLAGIDSHADTSVFDDDADGSNPDEVVDKGLGLNDETAEPQVTPKEKGKNILDFGEGLIHAIISHGATGCIRSKLTV